MSIEPTLYDLCRTWYPLLGKEAFAQISLGLIAGSLLQISSKITAQVFHLQPHLFQKAAAKLYEDAKKGHGLRVMGKSIFYIGCAPLEEFLFRGLLYDYQKSNKRTSDTPIQSMIYNAALFSLAHFKRQMPLKSQIHIHLHLFAMGVTFCYLAQSTGNLLASTTGHTAFNALACRQLYIMGRTASRPPI